MSFSACACQGEDIPTQDLPEIQNEQPGGDNSSSGNETPTNPVTEPFSIHYTETVPSEYFQPASEQGTVEVLWYDSKDYTSVSKSATRKPAYVYLPYGYDASKKGYNAFALIYRPGWETAMDDLARTIALLVANADKLDIDMEGYSLWGGSAGARMAATLGSSASAYGVPRAGAVVMQYTGHGDWTRYDPPTYACCGTSDGIASWQGMKSRLDAMTSAGIPTEFHSYQGLPHGFGLGTGTVAEGWIDDAVKFWETNTKKR